MEFVKEISTVPERISTKEYSIYKAVSIRNSGLEQWPSQAFLFASGDVSGTKQTVQPLQPGKDMSCVLIISSPKKVGKFISRWNLAFNTADGNVELIGDAVVLAFEINEPEEKQILNSVDQQILKEEARQKKLQELQKKKEEEDKERKIIEEQEKALEKIEAMKKAEEMKKLQELEKKFAEEAKKKALEQKKLEEEKRMEELYKSLKDIFPDAKKDVVKEFIKNEPKLTLEELIENYLMQAK